MLLEYHDAQTVAELIYASAPEMFGLLFGRAAVRSIQNGVVRSQNRFSHRYVQIAEAEGQIVGVATLIPATELHNSADDDSIFDFWTRLRRQIAYRLILDRVLEQNYPAGSFYIANLAVQASHRGQGIGTQLLQHCIAQTAGADQLFISVDIHNPRAQKLYESLGFRVVQTKTITLLNISIGSRVLARLT